MYKYLHLINGIGFQFLILNKTIRTQKYNNTNKISETIYEQCNVFFLIGIAHLMFFRYNPFMDSIHTVYIYKVCKKRFLSNSFWKIKNLQSYSYSWSYGKFICPFLSEFLSTYSNMMLRFVLAFEGITWAA